MKDPFEIIGFWWLPENEDNELPGILKFSQDVGVYLEVVGLFQPDLNRMKENENQKKLS